MLRKWLQNKWPPYLKIIFKICLSLLIFTIILKNVDLKLMFQLISLCPFYLLLAAIVLFILSKIVSAIRYQLFLESESIHLSLMDSIRIYWLGMYYNLLLPGGISGDAYKIKLLSERFGTSISGLLKISLLDRFSGVLALAQIATALLLFIPSFNPYSGIILLILILSFGIPWILNRYFKRLQTSQNIQVSILSLGVQLSQTFSVLCLIYALGQSHHFITYSLVFLVSSLAAMLPITIGGAGARELTFLYGARFLGTEIEKAVAIAFLFYLISTFVSLFGIFYSFKSINFRNHNQ